MDGTDETTDAGTTTGYDHVVGTATVAGTEMYGVETTVDT